MILVVKTKTIIQKNFNITLLSEEESLFLHGEEVVGGQPLLSDSDSEENEAPTPTIIQTQDDIEYRNEFTKRI